jgi:sec-independent protein translocase protein TatA
MFGSLGAPELIIIGLVIVLLFGVGKISGLGREIGGSIKEFRKAVKDEDDKDKAAPVQQSATTQAAPPPPPQAQQPPAETKKPNLF